MSEWHKVKIGDVCTITKGVTGIQKAVAGDYPMVTLAEERTTHNEFQFDCEAVIVPLVSSTGHGHASMKRVHYQKGKFALGSILCAVIPNDPNFLSPKYLHIYISYLKDKLLVSLMRGAANVSLSISNIKTVEVIVPPIERQLEIIELEKVLRTQKGKLGKQNTFQQSHLALLRQQILQDAITGKLTANWRDNNPDIEPASVLLKKIKAEKENLINNGKLKKENPLSPISKDEIPFELPKEWEWCRLSEIISLKSGNSYSYQISNKGVPYVKVGDMNLGENCLEILISSTYFDEKNVKDRDLIPVNSIIFPKRGGAIATNKKRMVLQKPILVDSNTMAILLPNIIEMGFVFQWFQTIDISKFGNNSVIPQVNNKDINPILFPLPPRAEQRAIVAKVEMLIGYVSQLQKKIAQSANNAETLMQSFLAEVFNY